MHGIGKRFVYVLRSDADHEHHYVGITSDVAARVEWHNDGPCGHTIRHRPWSLVVVVEFPTEPQAARFEEYLKTVVRAGVRKTPLLCRRVVRTGQDAAVQGREDSDRCRLKTFARW